VAIGKLEGGCLCRAIRYRITDSPSGSMICHCRTCQRLSAAPTVAWITVARQFLHFTLGELSSFRSSPPVQRTFCSQCGTPISYAHNSEPEFIDVTTCSREIGHPRDYGTCVDPCAGFDEIWPLESVKNVEPPRGRRGYIELMHRYEKIRQGASSATGLPRWLFAGIVCLSATAGTVQASEIYKSIDANGQVVYSDHLDPSLSHSTAVQLDDPHVLPRELHFCWTNCFTLTLNNGRYRRADGTDESWTVQTFSTDAIVLHRHDPPAEWNGYSQDVVYAGQIANDRLVGVTVNGKPTSGIDASWGNALNTLPGTNAERDGQNTANPGSSSNGTVTSAGAPPPLPEEDQPALSQDGYLWTPGFWYWRDQRYLWSPGAWERPPQAGFLWTPAYWVPAGSVFVFHPGHWGSVVGFYGGINYGHGYTGNGYIGGHWIGDSFAYNSAVNHVDPIVAHHTYSESVPNQVLRSVSSYAAPTRSGGGTQTMSQHQAPPRAVIEPAAALAQRTSEKAPVPIEASKPAAIVKMPTPSATPKLNHVTPIRAAPVKQ
jgi:hypothetical protein